MNDSSSFSISFRKKNIFLLIASFLSLGSTKVFPETLYAIVQGDTVTIWNRNVEEICGSYFRYDVRLFSDTLEVTEVDTAVDHATCYCFYQLSVTITGLPPGHYSVPVYRRRIWGFPHDTTWFVGTTQFTIGPSSSSLTQWPYQSPCSQTPQAVGESALPLVRYVLHQCYPNPFNPTTTIVFDVPERSYVVLAVYNVLGQEVAVLADDVLMPGTHERSMSAANLASGVYICRLTAGAFNQTRRMLLQK